ncbi:DUF3892 domain-containing protein [Aestuariibius sp. HNIBRBA575]|uniref:DUF3892 domain-containing protein n=1 Tax=Aestuariibius sp. HNIBRBA575 TaxID=3233343 RepID=UPI0034A547C3
MSKITGNNDGPNGRNESYRVDNRHNVPRDVVVREVEDGLHPGRHIYERDGERYVRDNPDSSTNDNVNR